MDIYQKQPTIELSRVSDIRIPECMLHPYVLDNEPLNNIYSELGGIIPSQVIMLTGRPGTGKTTLATYTGSHISDYIKNNNKIPKRPHGPVIFISREMSDFQIKMLSTKVGDFDEMELIKDDTPGLWHDWMKVIHQRKIHPSLIIVDSIQKIAQEMGGSNNKNQIKIVEFFKKYSKATYTPTILIGHVSKAGQYIGPSYLQHEVDSHIHLTLDKDINGIVITQEKNRYNDITTTAMMYFEGDHLRFEGDTFKEIINDDITFEELLESFHGTNQLRKTILKSSVEKLFTKFIYKLKDKFREELDRSNIKNIKLKYNNSEKFYCNIKDHSITIGLKAINNFYDNTRSSYEHESTYMNKIVRTKEDVCIWSFLHEFLHLIEGPNHDTMFFQKIYKIAKENKQWFSNK